MALPNTINPNSPLGTDQRKLGDDQIRALKQALIDIFGIPNNQAVSGAVFSINTSGQISAISITGTPIDPKYIDFTDLVNAALQAWFKGSTPNVRLVGSEASGRDWRLVETQGVVRIDQNTGTESVPIWTAKLVLTSTGTIKFWNAGVTFSLELTNGATANRIINFPPVPTASVSDVVLTDAVQTLSSKTLTSPSMTTVQQLTMGTNKPILPATNSSGNPTANGLYSEGICKAWATFSTVAATTLQDSFNIASIADNGVGLTTLTYKTAMATSTYCFVSGSRVSGAATGVSVVAAAKATGSVQIRTVDMGNTTIDVDGVSVAIFGGQ